MNDDRARREAGILIVDDEPANLRLLHRILERGGYTDVSSTTDPREVEVLCAEMDPDMILLDLHMPHRDGFAVLEALAPRRAGGEYLPVVVLTADATTETRQRALAAGATDFLTKPIDPIEVILRIRNLLQTRFLYLDLHGRNRELEGQLHHARKMEAVGRLAGGIAHDFNNLLTVIRGCGEMIALSLEPGAPAQADVVEIHSAADRAADLTRQLLAFSRKQVLNPEVMDLNATVAAAAKMLRRLIGEDVELEVRLEPGLASIRADAGQISQVIMNLAVNARDAMPHGGRLRISTENVRPSAAEDAPAAGGTNTGDQVLLAVEDEGTGMDTETLERIFEPFFTTKPPDQGTGLGLSTAYGIVAQSGGDIRVRSEPGRGTTFRILLPVASGTAEPDPVMAAPPTEGTGRVLLVEDEPAVRNLARRFLERGGYTVLEAANAEEAMRTAVAERGIDLLLTDLVMPGISGSALAERLTSEHPRLRVIYMTGYTDEAVLRNGALGHRREILRKPFSGEELTGRVREVLAG